MTQVWILLFIVVLFRQSHQATEAKNCSVAGRFPNDLNNDCRGYTMCLKVLNDFTRIDLVCPEHSVYSHIDNQCTNITGYYCLPEYNCTHVGDFPNLSVSDCSSYISCAEGLGNIVTARVTNCPNAMLFDPAERACVNNTMFECVVTTPEPPKVFEVSIKVSPEPSHVNTASKACYTKTHYMIFVISSVIFMYS